MVRISTPSASTTLQKISYTSPPASAQLHPAPSTACHRVQMPLLRGGDYPASTPPASTCHAQPPHATHTTWPSHSRARLASPPSFFFSLHTTRPARCNISPDPTSWSRPPPSAPSERDAHLFPDAVCPAVCPAVYPAAYKLITCLGGE
ncbi:hypothetical protein BS50DRAFT_406519 [Corynespora cassiicola Philippines]|uniref:Uncharacterized protein n=1 Tax=Corynespora cassiicola Philippines TaxID=1448308 RepID=A0A2T2NM07_CORCC|nr:hypothetical protein BS50DRAFT_406519 [Corynespora cassiicola Philippines]